MYGGGASSGGKVVVMLVVVVVVVVEYWWWYRHGKCTEQAERCSGIFLLRVKLWPEHMFFVVVTNGVNGVNFIWLTFSSMGKVLQAG